MAPSRTSSPPSPAHDPNTPGLTPSQLAFYHENGYLIIPSALDANTISSLLTETKRMLDTISLTDHPMTKFTTGQGDDYFLTSGDKIRFFFEEDAFTTPTTPNQPPTLLHPPSQSINKIGHSLHTLSAPFRHATLSPFHAAVARALGFRDPRVLQSMLICKQPGIGGAVPPHQDSTFLYTDPPSAVGFWIALEAACRENGCLGFVPGSQRRVGVGRRFVRLENGGGTGFVGVERGRFPEGEGDGDWEERGEEEGDYTLAEVEAGTLVLIHGNLLHKSERNLSGRSRLAYTFHVIEGENVYDERNWLQPPEGGFTRLYQGGK